MLILFWANLMACNKCDECHEQAKFYRKCKDTMAELGAEMVCYEEPDPDCFDIDGNYDNTSDVCESTGHECENSMEVYFSCRRYKTTARDTLNTFRWNKRKLTCAREESSDLEHAFETGNCETYFDLLFEEEPTEEDTANE